MRAFLHSGTLKRVAVFAFEFEFEFEFACMRFFCLCLCLCLCLSLSLSVSLSPISLSLSLSPSPLHPRSGRGTGSRYDFYGVGEYWLVQSSIVDVQVRHRSTGSASANTAFELLFHDSGARIGMYPSPAGTVIRVMNSQAAYLTSSAMTYLEVVEDATVQCESWRSCQVYSTLHGFELSASGGGTFMNIHVSVLPNFINETRGLCASYNGDASDDISYIDYDRVRRQDSIMWYDPPNTWETYNKPPDGYTPSDECETSELEDAATTACAEAAECDMVDDCVKDVCATGDINAAAMMIDACETRKRAENRQSSNGTSTAMPTTETPIVDPPGPPPVDCLPFLDENGPLAACFDVVDPGPFFTACREAGQDDDAAAAGSSSSTISVAGTCQVVTTYRSRCIELGVVDMLPVVDQCGVCFGDGSSCTPATVTCSVQDPGLISTFSGYVDSFSGICDYVLAADCAPIPEFSVQVRKVTCDLSSCNRVVALQYGLSTVIELTRLVVLVNGQEVSALPVRMSDGVVVDGQLVSGALAGAVTVTMPNGVSAVWNPSTGLVRTTVPRNKFANRLCGLCGEIGDGTDPASGLITSEGSAAASLWLHAKSWIIDTEDASLFVDPDPTCTIDDVPPPHPCTFNATLGSVALRRCEQAIGRGSEFDRCNTVVDPEPFIELCQAAICSAREAALSSSSSIWCDAAVAEYETRCRAAGVLTIAATQPRCAAPQQPITCTLLASRYLTTFAGLTADFPGQCSFVLARSVSRGWTVYSTHNLEQEVATISLSGRHRVSLMREAKTVVMDNAEVAQTPYAPTPSFAIYHDEAALTYTISLDAVGSVLVWNYDTHALTVRSSQGVLLNAAGTGYAGL